QLGHGPGIVALHGSMESARSHMQLAAALAGRFTVYLPDRRGRGMSGAYGANYNMQREVEDLDALLANTGAQRVFRVSSGGPNPPPAPPPPPDPPEARRQRPRANRHPSHPAGFRAALGARPCPRKPPRRARHRHARRADGPILSACDASLAAGGVHTARNEAGG